MTRTRKCSTCRHSWVSPVEMTMKDPIPDGALRVTCPKCGSRSVSSDIARKPNPCTKRELTFKNANWSKDWSYTVPVGTHVEPIKDEPGMYWVIPSVFAPMSFARHDATHYGFRVKEEDVAL